MPGAPILLAATVGVGQELPAERPDLQVARLAAAPVLDGDVLGDSAWHGVIPATDFWQTRPNDGEPATQETQVFVGYTDYALYVGVIAFDDEPTEIIVTDSRRDSSLDDTDAFIMIIDGLLDRQNGYVFGTNPAGIEYDGQVTGEGASSGGAGFQGQR